MVTNEEGSFSIETALSLPLFVLILLSFTYIINLVSSSDNIMFDITKNILNSSTENYFQYRNNLSYTYSFEHNDYSARIRNFNLNYNINNDVLNVNVKYKYKFPFTYLNDFENDKNIETNIFASGLSLLDYGINANYINSDFDIWSLSNIDRAKAISELEEGFADFDGTQIDKIYNGRLVSIVSLDYRKESYNDRFNISNKVKRDIDALYKFNAGNINGTYIGEDDYHGKILNLVLPSDDYDIDVEKQLMILKTYSKNKGIDFIVTIID